MIEGGRARGECVISHSKEETGGVALSVGWLVGGGVHEAAIN